MAFTLAHPAAAVPLRRVLGGHGVLSALVIGSMAPDFWYLAPFVLTRTQTHSIAALFWFCLPAGLLVYVVYHEFMKGPCLELLPAALVARLAACGMARSGLPGATWRAVVASLLAGAATHLAWDAATHDGALVERVLPALDGALFSIGSYEAYGYSLLQHVSTLAGLVLLACWTCAWYRRTVVGQAPPRRLSPAAAIGVLFAAGAAYAWIVVSAGAAAWQHHASVAVMRDLAKAAAGQAAATALLALFAYAVGWHALGFAARGKRP